MSPPEPIWQAWCDGTASPNPGRLGIGILLLPPGPESLAEEHSRPLGRIGCNNEAELLALSATLEIARAAGARQLQLHSDSRVAVDYVSGTAATAIPRLVVLIEQVRQQIAAFDQVRLQWVPQHRNLVADRLSRASLGLPEKIKKRR